LRLTHFKLCPFSRAARILIGELHLEANLDPVLPWALTPAFLNKTPSARLPVLELDDETHLSGFYALSEFMADAQIHEMDIADLLTGAPHSDELPAKPLAVMPGDIEDRAEIRRLIEWFHQKCDREVTQEFLYEKVRLVLDRRVAAPPNAGILRSARSNLRYHLDYIGFLSDQRRWLGGDDFSLADIVAAAHVSIADYLGEIIWEDVPHALGWYQRVKSRKSFRPLLGDRLVGVAPAAHYAELDF